MSVFGTVQLTWSNGTDTFCLGSIASRLDLEHKCNAGLGTIFKRLHESGEWYQNDIREIIRIGLIGGGMTPRAAQGVIERHVDHQPLSELVLVACSVIGAVMFAPPGEQPGKPRRTRTRRGASTSSTKTEGSPGSLSTPPARD